MLTLFFIFHFSFSSFSPFPSSSSSPSPSPAFPACPKESSLHLSPFRPGEAQGRDMAFPSIGGKVDASLALGSTQTDVWLNPSLRVIHLPPVPNSIWLPWLLPLCPCPILCSVSQVHHLPFVVLSPLLIVGKGLYLVQFAMLRKRCEFWCPLYRVFLPFL
jgi:hypothetical protein